MRLGSIVYTVVPALRRRIRWAAVTLLFVLATPRDTSGNPTVRARYVFLALLGIVAVGASLASLYYVFKTGDSGARMVWSGS